MKSVSAITLPNCDLAISRVGLGGCPLGGFGWGTVDDEDAVAAVRQAFDCGINFFDTADIYGLGHSERLLAKALGPNRGSVVIASKFGVRRVNGKMIRDSSPAWLRTAVEESLRRLGIESIPLYYIHWPDANTPISETIGELKRIRQSGKIQAFGVSNFSVAQIVEAHDVAPISAVQGQLSLIDQAVARPLLAELPRLHLPLVTWGSLAHGLLTGKYDGLSQFADDDRRSRYPNFQSPKLCANLRVVGQLRQEAVNLQITPAQVAIRWLLDTPGVGCVLFGAKRREQVLENAAATALPPLPPAVYERLCRAALDSIRCDHLAAA
jgi:aryl-alcohol dehydrogenase-like predicted oxidoreductase